MVPLLSPKGAPSAPVLEEISRRLSFRQFVANDAKRFRRQWQLFRRPVREDGQLALRLTND